MKNTSIQWADHTFNPWLGCTKVAPECKNCYAETLMDHRFGHVKWGKGQPRRRTNPSNWATPRAWNREAEAIVRQRIEEDIGPVDYRPKVFCLSLGDWLDEEVPIQWLADLLRLIYDTPYLDWLLLTKRPGNFSERICKAFEFVGVPENYNESAYTLLEGWISEGDAARIPPNIWIGVSAGAELQLALNIPAKIHFLSCEPMLRPLYDPWAGCFDWIIFGGESGRNARACDVNWIRDGIKYCRKYAAAPFVKQLGAKPINVGPLEDSHGGNCDEWPEDLRVREFPRIPKGMDQPK